MPSIAIAIDKIKGPLVYRDRHFNFALNHRKITGSAGKPGKYEP
jgi:hypothetical protein